jgi:hypothetical protein
MGNYDFFSLTFLSTNQIILSSFPMEQLATSRPFPYALIALLPRCALGLKTVLERTVPLWVHRGCTLTKKPLNAVQLQVKGIDRMGAGQILTDLTKTNLIPSVLPFHI